MSTLPPSSQKPGPKVIPSARRVTEASRPQEQLERVAQTRTEMSNLQERITQLTLENQFLKESGARRQADFEALKKLEAIWTEQIHSQAQKIRSLEAQNQRLESWISRTKAVIRDRFDWLKSYQERLTSYAKSINTEKLRLKELVQELSQNFQEALQNHPFLEEIDKAQREINQLNTQLLALPPHSKRRLPLENQVHRLGDRVILLQLGIENTRQILTSQTLSTRRTLEFENLNASPPPPPQPQATSH